MSDDEKGGGMFEFAHPTAPGGMPQKALVDELIEKHDWTEEDARALTWPGKIDAVIEARRAAEKKAEPAEPAEPAEAPESENHEHGDWDQGGYCNRLVMREGDADVCGYREVEPPRLALVPPPEPETHAFIRSDEGSGRVCMAEGCGEGPGSVVHARNADGFPIDQEGLELDEEEDPEEFCGDCFAGMESSEHFEKCTVPERDAEIERIKAPVPDPPKWLGNPPPGHLQQAEEWLDAAGPFVSEPDDAIESVPALETAAEPLPANAFELCTKTDLYKIACSHCQSVTSPEVEAVVSGAPLPPAATAAELGIPLPPPLAAVEDEMAAHRARLIATAEAVGWEADQPEGMTLLPEPGTVGDPAARGSEAEKGPMLKVSNSELRKFKRCRRSWWLTYYRGLTPRREGVGPLSIGNMVHKPLELYYAQPQRDPAAFDWETPLAAYVEERLADPALPDHLHADMLGDYELVKSMLRGYFDWLQEEGVDSEINVLAAEREIEAYLDTINGVEIHLIGKLDTEIELKADGRRAFMDHKSAANLTDLPKMGQKDEQFLQYGLLQRLEAAAQGITDRRYAHGGVWNMLRKVKRTATAKPPFYGRSGVSHNDEAYRNFYARVWGEVRDILTVRANLDAGGSHHVEAYPNPTRDCSWDCPFAGICPQFDDGSDVESILAAEYVHHDPYERYEEIEKG